MRLTYILISLFTFRASKRYTMSYTIMGTTPEPDITDEHLDQVFQDLRAIANGGGRIKWQGLSERAWIALWNGYPTKAHSA